MRYEPIQPIDQSEAEAHLTSDDQTLIADSLLRASLSDIDHCWVENACLQALLRSELAVRRTALLALAHLARRCKQVDISTIMAAVRPLRTIPSLSGTVDDLLDDINMFVCNETARD